jgi:phenylacetate-CoA ligase
MIVLFNKIIYLLGTKLRNNHIFDSYSFLKKSEEWSIDELKSYQLKKCKELVTYAYNNSYFYKNKFDKNNIEPSDLKQLEDLSKFPIVTKNELLNQNDEIQIKVKSEKMFFSETSGSSGEPLVFYRNAKWDARHRAAIFRGYSWYNVHPWNKNGYFWGYNLSSKEKFKTKILDFLQNRFRIFSYDKDSIKSFAKKLSRADYLEGYSSMIYETAKIINQNNMNITTNLKMIKGTSEKIYDKYQEEVMTAFGKKMISEYGAAEAGIIAFECPEGNMHITMENVIVEEENSEIVITNLLSQSFPIIRYKLGDYIKVNKEKKCDCGMNHYIIEDVLGRVGNLIYGKNKKYPSLTLYYIFKNLALNHNLSLNYQAIQNKKSKLNINVEQEINNKEKNLLINEVEKYFDNDIDYIINTGINIKNIDGKQKDFISNIKD